MGFTIKDYAKIIHFLYVTIKSELYVQRNKRKAPFSPKTSIQIKIADFNQYFFILKITTFPVHDNYNYLNFWIFTVMQTEVDSKQYL